MEKKAKAEAERARRLAGRKDAKLKGVVISEKWDKKWQKYTTPNLPFPYSQKEVRDCFVQSVIGFAMRLGTQIQARHMCAAIDRNAGSNEEKRSSSDLPRVIPAVQI